MSKLALTLLAMIGSLPEVAGPLILSVPLLTVRLAAPAALPITMPRPEPKVVVSPPGGL